MKPYLKKLIGNLNGMIPPQDKELEEAVLGAVLLESKQALKLASGTFKEQIFFYEPNQLIARAVLHLVKEGKPVDLLTVRARLKEVDALDRVGNTTYLTSMTRKVNSSVHIEHHLAILTEHYLKRELIKLSDQTTHVCYQPDTDAFEAINNVATSVQGLIQGLDTGQTISIQKAVMTASVEMFERQGKQGVTGFSYGFDKLDEATGGAVPGELIIFAARPAMGKTAMALNIAANMAKHTKVGMFTMEMRVNGPGELMDRLIGMYSGLDTIDIKRFVGMEGKEHILNDALSQVHDLQLVFDESSRPTELQLRQKMFTMADQGCNVFIVDYLQMVQGFGENRNLQVESVCATLKQTAKDLNVPIILLCQLSRETEKSGSKKPMLAHLRDSGAIEQYGNVIFGLYRPEYYNIVDYEGYDARNLLSLVPLKNRSGSLSEILLTYNLQTQLITNFQGSILVTPLMAKANKLSLKRNNSFFEE